MLGQVRREGKPRLARRTEEGALCAIGYQPTPDGVDLTGQSCPHFTDEETKAQTADKCSVSHR